MQHLAGGVCDACGSALVAHTGPVVGRGYRHRPRLVAHALIAVSRGVSYTRAAHQACASAGHDPTVGTSGGQLVAECDNAWAPRSSPPR